MANVVLIGATGFVGSAILNELLARGHKVTAVVRNAAKLPKNDNLTAVEEDVANVDAIANIAKGKDAVISAYNPGWNNPDIKRLIEENYPKIVEAVKKSGVQRLLIVGGAGTLFVKPGLRVVDSGFVPTSSPRNTTSTGCSSLLPVLSKMLTKASVRASSVWARTTSSWTLPQARAISPYRTMP